MSYSRFKQKNLPPGFLVVILRQRGSARIIPRDLDPSCHHIPVVIEFLITDDHSAIFCFTQDNVD